MPFSFCDRLPNWAATRYREENRGMSKPDVIRAWKDEQYRSSLKGSELAALPSHPAGMIDLSEIEVGAIVGGTDGTLPTGCIPTCTQRGCLSLGGLVDFES